MNSLKELFLKRINQLIEEGEKLFNITDTIWYPTSVEKFSMATNIEREFKKWALNGKTIIIKICLMILSENTHKNVEKCHYLKEWRESLITSHNKDNRKKIKNSPITIYFPRQTIADNIIILKAIKDEIKSGVIFIDPRNLVAADIYETQIEMARNLLENGYVRVAGITMRVALETELRKLAENEGIQIIRKGNKGRTVYKSASELNKALLGRNKYDKLTYKIIETCLEAGHKCAHESDEKLPSPEELKLRIEDAHRILEQFLS